MTSSLHQEESTPLRDSTTTEEHLPIGPLHYEIRSSTNRLNPETQHEVQNKKHKNP